MFPEPSLYARVMVDDFKRLRRPILVRYACKVARRINAGQVSCGVDDWRVREFPLIVISYLYPRDELSEVHVIMFSHKLMIIPFSGVTI